MILPFTYHNGNAEISLLKDGTRTIQYEGNLLLDYPLNIDIRVSTACAFGMNPDTGKSTCKFCHESSRVDGVECNYTELVERLRALPMGMELAIGVNNYTPTLQKFLEWCGHKFVCNITINQGMLTHHNAGEIYAALNLDHVHGVGISYRKKLHWHIPPFLLNYPNTVFHCIVGIDSVWDILALHKKGVRKILCLGEKDFGFNAGKVNLESKKHKHWYWNVRKLVDVFDVVSFDNLALEQLNMRRFFTDAHWAEFYQGEHSMYINAAEGYYAPSSRSTEHTSWDNLSIQEYYEHR